MHEVRDISRIEGFSDAVFGFAITLLVVSLEVPTRFSDLVAVFKGLPAFGITFAMLLLVWHEHHSFFQRYGLRDGPTIWLNGALLFVVMVYIYPLKFLFSLIAGPQGSFAAGTAPPIAAHELVTLMVIYGIGFASIFALLAVMYWRAARLAPSLGLSAPARREAYVGVGHSLVYVAVAFVSIAIVLVVGVYGAFWGGIAYGLIGPAQGVYHRLAERRMTET